MDKDTALHLLQMLIDYFEAGNKESDAVAKTILEWDFEYDEYWAEKLQAYQKSGWTRIRGPEAELMALALRELQTMLGEEKRGELATDG